MTSKMDGGGILHAARPAAEAALLAAVALGCAQMGWSALTANAAHSSSPDTTSTTAHPRASVGPMEVRSPFSPTANLSETASSQAAAMLANLRVSGVRMADDGGRSGAILTVEGDNQRAFQIGQEISNGVRLTDVRADYVMIAYEGGQRQIAVESAPQRYSFARALMGQEQSAPPPPEVRIISDAPAAQPAAAPAAPTPFTAQAPERRPAPQAQAVSSDAEQAWLSSTLSRVEMVEGRARGWRVADPAPMGAATAGLRGGDLVVSINGFGPDQIERAAGAAAGGPVRLEILRGDAALTITVGAALGANQPT